MDTHPLASSTTLTTKEGRRRTAHTTVEYPFSAHRRGAAINGHGGATKSWRKTNYSSFCAP